MAIQELPHDLRTALLLFAVEGHSQQECAELLGVSAKSVETRVYRARKRLKDTLRAIR
jgi:RNA polymerase sigma-70 factor (ECF subfamily)